MKKEDDELQTISVYWWNFRSKTIDFKGSYKDYLKMKDIKVSVIKHPITKFKGYRFTIPTSSTITRHDCFGSYKDGCDNAIEIFLTIMGDRALFIDGYGRERRFE